MQGRARLLLSLCCGCCLLLLLAAHLRLDSAVRSYSYMNVVQQVRATPGTLHCAVNCDAAMRLGISVWTKLYAIKIIKLF